MLSKGPAKKVTIYLNEDARHHHGSLYEAVMAFLLEKGVAGATVTRGLAGFGLHQTLHNPNIELSAQHMPMVVQFVESAAKADQVLPALYDMVTDGMIEVQDTTVVKAGAPRTSAGDAVRPRQVSRGKGKMMRIYLGEADKWRGEPLYEAIVQRLRMLDIAGATVYRGVLGYGAKGHTHKERLLHFSRDLPVMISVIDQAEKLAEARPVLEEMLGDGLIVFSDVEFVRVREQSPMEEAANDAGAAG